MRPLLIVGDHPLLHRGFSTVGRHIARGLHATGRWRVTMIGRYPRPDEGHPEPYQVLEADRIDDVAGEGDARCCKLLQAALGTEPREGEPTPLLSIGTPFDQQRLLDGLAETGLRSHVRIVAYLALNYAPLPPGASRLLAQLDAVVPFTAFAARALADGCPRVGPPAVTTPIPHGVETGLFRPPDPAARRALRTARFGLGDSGFLVGYFGRNSGHKRPDLALRVFSTFALGAWSRCEGCSGTTAWALDPIDDSRTPPESCRQCGSSRVVPGTPNRHSRLYLHSELLTREQRTWSGGWDLARLIAASGVEDRVDVAPALRVGEGVSVTGLAALMGACDVHLLPSEGGGWELTVLETAACGVPSVITDAGAPPEYAAPFSMLVPPAASVLDSMGMRAFIDEGLAVDALVRLAADGDLRARLGAAGRAVAITHRWESIVPAWDRLLAELSTDGPRAVGKTP